MTSSDADPTENNITDTAATRSDVADKGGGTTDPGSGPIHDQNQEGPENEGENEGEEIWQRRLSLQAAGGMSQEEQNVSLGARTSVDSVCLVTQLDEDAGKGWS